ncbi:hypothetical protein D3C81_2028180 [compost metagenome]
MPFICRLCNRSPEWKLRLHVDPEQVRSGKSCFRRTAGVETVMVDAVGFGNTKNSHPFLYVGRGVAGQWEDQPVVFAAQKGLLSIDRKLVAVRLEFP